MAEEGGPVTLNETFTEEETRSFEERRDEVIALVIQASNLNGREHQLPSAVHRCRRAHTERQFDQAYESLVEALTSAPLSA